MSAKGFGISYPFKRKIPHKIAWDCYWEREHFTPGTVKPARPENSFSPEKMKELENDGQLNLLEELDEDIDCV